eukprot:CAMPEP_0196761940 /NCGR_PEP_ID=MMETSP1095-20130614/1254_1 /TAXON_ID=96789 ORGANISM="Chromulina nebulosa, Strain UTEXLB2642" /NCGR_SAMPLE_ID=MMETSP1095 /ASSEMBLY_ACC=CAM_ASM_000446 /LENGTH=720 /DNA_ID=CAMNT_0042112063 /DNA_START=58 /DNA_END=2220 /DNA_ORIENTATION=-
MNIINSETLPGNLLPNFMFQQGSIEGGSVGVGIGGGRGTAKPFSPDDSCLDDIFDGAMEDMRSPQLPYLTQDLWTCDRESTDIPIWIMETDEIKVTITPQYDGKVWTIYDKIRKRDILYNNKAHQPANIGALKSWASGGAEWNWSPGIIGHSAFSETQVYLAKVETSRGPMLRVYEYDRYNGTTWQVDMIIHNGTFYAHPKLTNPTDVDLRGYWWTCVAVDSTPSTRIFAPANVVAETSRDPMRYAPWPYFAEAIENASFQGYQDAWPTDNSYIGNHQIGDMFLRIPKDFVQTPYIGHTDLDGYTLIHGHPLNGTKFFTWGQSGPGRFMQDFLAGGQYRQGDYTELQVGPAPTQMQNFAFPKESTLQWTEWFKGFDGQIDKLLDQNYSVSINYINQWIDDEFSHGSVVSDWDKFFEEHVEKDPSEILVRGTGAWGALEELRSGNRLSKGLIFELPDEDLTSTRYLEAKPWIELIELGTFSEDTLSRFPLSYQTTDSWFKLLKQSAEKHGMTWLHAFHIGICLTERGDVTESINMFTYSYTLKPYPVTSRNIAVLQQSQEEAWEFYKGTWQLALQLYSGSTTGGFTYDQDTITRLLNNLVTEISFFLQQNLWYTDMAAFISTVPENFRWLDSFITLKVKYLIHISEYDEAKVILQSECFPTYAKARSDLMSLWNEVIIGQAMVESQVDSLSAVEKHRIRMNDPIPKNIGCQYASEYCLNYW